MPSLVSDLGIGDDVVQGAKPAIGNDRDCEVSADQATKACYWHDRIFMLPSAFTYMDGPHSILAHEVYHYVWAMEDIDRVKIEMELMQLYNTYPALQQRMTAWKGLDHTGLVDELHSVVCTEVYDDQLSAELLSHCTEWVPNRISLPASI